LKAAEHRGVHLVAMPTTGRHGFLDAVRGSTTSQVVARAPCPVLTLPLVGA
jgi:nucleotide-binding universal stress UspA family protein